MNQIESYTLNKKTHCEICQKPTHTSIENWCCDCESPKGTPYACYRCGDADCTTPEGFYSECHTEVFN